MANYIDPISIKNLSPTAEGQVCLSLLVRRVVRPDLLVRHNAAKAAFLRAETHGPHGQTTR